MRLPNETRWHVCDVGEPISCFSLAYKHIITDDSLGLAIVSVHEQSPLICYPLAWSLLANDSGDLPPHGALWPSDSLCYMDAATRFVPRSSLALTYSRKSA